MRKSFLLFCFMVLVGSVQAQPKLYKITGNGLKSPSYIMGTQHMLCDTHGIITPTMENALAQSKKLVCELDMDNTMMQVRMLKLMINKDSSISQLMGSDYPRFVQLCKDSLGLDPSGFDKFKPMMSMSMFSLKTMPCESKTGTEQLLMSRAKKKEIVGLETVDDQVGVFDSIPDREELEMLWEIASSPSKGKSEMSKLEALYRSGNTEGMYKLVVESPDFKGFTNLLLDNRNRRWIPILAKMMAKESVFIAVGCGHLGGEVGVLSLLKQAGYTVEEVR